VGDALRDEAVSAFFDGPVTTAPTSGGVNNVCMYLTDQEGTKWILRVVRGRGLTAAGKRRGHGRQARSGAASARTDRFQTPNHHRCATPARHPNHQTRLCQQYNNGGQTKKVRFEHEVLEQLGRQQLSFKVPRAKPSLRGGEPYVVLSSGDAACVFEIIDGARARGRPGKRPPAPKRTAHEPRARSRGLGKPLPRPRPRAAPAP
jgi:hypothetical protein